MLVGYGSLGPRGGELSLGGQRWADPARAGFLEARGRVTEVSKSLIPQVTIYSVDCGDIRFKFDMHSKLLKVKQGDEVVVTISKEAPEYDKGVDLVMWGYVLSVKAEAVPSKMVISLWGYIVIVEVDRRDLLSGFDFMDKVYFKVAVAR